MTNLPRISTGPRRGIRQTALIWPFSELLVKPMNGEGIYELYRQRAEAAEQRTKPQPAQTVPQPGSVEWFEAQNYEHARTV